MAGKDRLFLDSEVVLDHLADRAPFAEFSHRLFALAESHEVEIAVSSLSFSNLYFLLRKLRGHASAIELLAGLKKLATVVGVGEQTIEASLQSEFSDFEDAIQYFSAREAGGITAIITRNKRDYSASELPVMTAEEYLLQRARAS